MARYLHPLGVCARCDNVTVIPLSLSQALATFSDVYSLRIIGRVSDYDGRRPTSRRHPRPHRQHRRAGYQRMIPHGEKAGRVRLFPQERMFCVPSWRGP